MQLTDKEKIMELQYKIEELEDELKTWKEIDDDNEAKYQKIKNAAGKLSSLFMDFENMIDDWENYEV